MVLVDGFIKAVIRRLWLGLLALGLGLSGASGLSAQDAPLTIVLRPGQSEADIKPILDIAAQSGRAVSIRMDGAASPSSSAVQGNTSATTQQTSQVASAPAQPTPQPTMEMPETAAANMGMASWERLTSAFGRGASTAVAGLLGMSTMMDMTKSQLEAEGIGHGRILFVALSAIAAGLVAAGLVRTLFALAMRHRDPRVHRIAGKFRRAFKRLIGDLVSVAIFLGVARLVLHMLLRDNTVAFEVGRGVVAVALVSLIYLSVGRFLFRPDQTGQTLIAIRHPQWHFRILAVYGVISAFFSEAMRISDQIGLDRGSIDGLFLIGGTLLTLLKLIWFIGGRSSIRDAFIGENSGLVRRVIGNILPDFYTVSAIFIWLSGFLVAGTPDSARWSYAAVLTQVILLVLPILALGAHHVVDEFARHCETTGGPGLMSSILASLRVVCSGAVWIGGLHLIAALWWPLMAGDAAIATGWIIWLERLSFAIVASWAVCTLIWRYSESIAPSPHVQLPGQEDEQAKKQTSRLSTALPVVRNLALGAVLAVGALLVLSSIGINVAPLLAGFGVLGLALSFGSQALVKDVVSGIFFITDDAFRIGEYIDTGKLQGTVEQITVRSIRLRHHNGPIHTIPFGQISSVTNFSRDWGTTKFQLRYERDADAEVIRKIAKKIGLALLEDPEFGPEFLIPLKMQGIQDITENSMIVRFKFTSRPGNPSLIKREAMKRLIADSKAAGLEFASNAVTVRSGAGGQASTEAAAAASLPTATPIAV
ncbi:mechanosensitive ion channel family protein [Neorhizobium alkalisoli]|uniref:Small-conductance mechanosensitive channel n=1 Tax=Neorhizobium alkalisoli TaxID=528178 RepID=A0A561R2X3_9HYPH|nr:mechanosensitive ion channel family protein [Neorhizobium alkalisoli]TWF56949.1 small-conductance mechanosensitive channel [Neorhizobium alkalisoli]